MVDQRIQDKREKSQWTSATPGKKKFKIHINCLDWRRIAPKEGELKLRRPWTQKPRLSSSEKRAHMSFVRITSSLMKVSFIGRVLIK